MEQVHQDADAAGFADLLDLAATAGKGRVLQGA
jgi:hypothetical protein